MEMKLSVKIKLRPQRIKVLSLEHIDETYISALPQPNINRNKGWQIRSVDLATAVKIIVTIGIYYRRMCPRHETRTK